MKDLIIEKSLDNCLLLNIESMTFQCNLQTICSPVQNDIKKLIKNYTNSAVKIPFLHFNSVFYGTNFNDIFPVKIENFLNKYGLTEYKISNGTFSFLYVKQNQLYSHDQLPLSTKIICSLSTN